MAGGELGAMLSALLMFRRVAGVVRHAVREDAVLYQLIGIGILVEILRRFGVAFVAVRAAEKKTEAADR